MSLFNDSIDYGMDVFRNIRSIAKSQDLFDDLSDDPADWEAAIALEIQTHPPLTQSQIIQRGFDYSQNDFIDYPFQNITASRYSDGSFPVWYGSESLETSIFETRYHFLKEIADAPDAFLSESILRIDRKVGQVLCRGLAFDLSQKKQEFPCLIDVENYIPCQQIGKRVSEEGHPLLRVPSARDPKGINLVVFSPDILSDAREFCRLSYHYDLVKQTIQIERGKTILCL